MRSVREWLKRLVKGLRMYGATRRCLRRTDVGPCRDAATGDRMRVFAHIFRFRRATFTPLEKAVLAVLEDKLAPPARSLLQRQLANVNLVQRHSAWREVCCYHLERGKPVHDHELEFPANARELRIATMRFAPIQFPGYWRVDFVLVYGYLFSIVFDPSPKPIRRCTEIQVSDIRLLHDPMKPTPVEPRPSTDTITSALPAWVLQTFPEGVTNVRPPLHGEDRKKILQSIEATLPKDYIDMTETCEGFSGRDWSVMGVAEVYRVVIPDGNYYVIAEWIDKGALCLRALSKDGMIYYAGYDGGTPIPVGRAIAMAVHACKEKESSA